MGSAVGAGATVGEEAAAAGASEVSREKTKFSKDCFQWGMFCALKW